MSFGKKIVNTTIFSFIIILASCSESTDLPTFQLKGKVKKYVINDDTLYFSRSGKLTSISSGTYSDVYVNHDNNDNISTVICKTSDRTLTIQFVFDKNRQLTQTIEKCNSDHNACNACKRNEIIKYTYKNGLRHHESHIFNGINHDEENRNYAIDYMYLTFDNNGNWTKRKLKYNNNGKEFIEQREIFYY